jgi:hypothetical protein
MGKKRTVFNNYISVIEWVGPKIDDRHVKVVFDKDRKEIHVNDLRRKPLRMLDFVFPPIKSTTPCLIV